MSATIEGRQPVREALRAGRKIERIMIADGARPEGVLGEILREARERGIPVETVARALLDERAESRAHQGVIAVAEAYRTRDWREGVEAARAAGRAPLVLALDGIQDPQNMGALLRSAEVLGVDAVIVPSRRSAPLGAGVAKAAAGALEHLVVDQVANVERALASCRQEGLWLVALAGEADMTVDACELLAEPVAVVVGAEGSGVSALIRKRADALVRIPMRGRVGSLNAAAAGAICLWEAARRR